MTTLKSILNEAYLNLIRESLSLEKAKEYTSIERNPEIQNRLDGIFSKLERKPIKNQREVIDYILNLVLMQRQKVK